MGKASSSADHTGNRSSTQGRCGEGTDRPGIPCPVNHMSEIKVPQIVAVGELLWDPLPSGPRLGGAVANFAVFSARLGNHSVLVSSVGDDESVEPPAGCSFNRTWICDSYRSARPIPPERSKLRSLPITSLATSSLEAWLGISFGLLLACSKSPCRGCGLFRYSRPAS